MEGKYREAFAALNPRQRQAVETIDGPVLVLAGPGTGKTQLISTRVGYLLQKTDTPPEAILLLTFTEAGVDAMRQRLGELIGRASYDVQLSTYHAFGGEIFRRYPDYFEGLELTLLEDLGADSLLRGIVAKLPYSDPLKFADSYINDLRSFISEAKRALLEPDDVEQIASDNLKFIAKISRDCRSSLNKLQLVSKKTVPHFQDLLDFITSYTNQELPGSVLPLARYAQGELSAALEHFDQTGKTSFITQWKRRWLARDAKGNYIIEGRRQNERLRSAAGIYRKYQARLRRGRLYDYDDMIIRAIEALETNPELRYSLAERYSYIMLDEFQDTNPAQFRLVQLLTDHPVHEGRPNILAVGDDDQAIYAFQGADHANMAGFIKHYRDVKIISLEGNYRSAAPILQTADNISAQIQSRLARDFPKVTKKLVPAARPAEEPQIQMREFISDAAQYDWVAGQIGQLIKHKIEPSQIAVLAPKHRYLTELLPYLAQHKLPVSYERRENILDEPIVRQLEQMARLATAISNGDERLSDHLWPEVLSYEFWKVPVDKIWQISWQARRSGEPWTSLLLNDDQLDFAASFFIKLSRLLDITTLEQQLDMLIGMPGAAAEHNLPADSPLYNHYFAGAKAETDAYTFTKLISDLNVLRARLLEWRRGSDEPAGLRALVEFIEGHRAANINVLNTSPYHDDREAVNLMTAYGAKGREFQAVFIIAAVDEVWGSASRNQGYRLSLPANLDYIRYQGASEDERLRLLYVAATRARTRLYFTGYQHDLAGKAATRLKYLAISEMDGNKLAAATLPAGFNRLVADDAPSIGRTAITDYWTRRHLPPFKPSLLEVLSPRLDSYRLSASDLNSFTDIVSRGPEAFFMSCLLRFASAPGVADSFGTAIHNTLRFAGWILINENRLPSADRLTEIFEAQLQRIELPPDELQNLSRRGADSLKAWLEQRGGQLSPSDLFEYDFKDENPRMGDIRLSGKIDRIIIDEKRRAITVVDYKTGRAYSKWQTGIVKLHLYKQQLTFYKLLIENSARFRKYKVEKGIIEFVEPDEDGRICQLELVYDDESLNRTVKLMKAVWKAIQSLQLPDISGYAPTVAGIRQFEKDLNDSPANQNRP